MPEHVTFLTDSWEETFSALFEQALRNLIIISPYITGDAVEMLCRQFEKRGDENEVNVRCLTNITSAALAGGSLEIGALLQLTNRLPRARVFHLGNLHAKVYLADERMALVTSANFTRGGMRLNREAGVRLDDPEQVAEIRAQVERFFQVSTPLERSDMERISVAAAELRSLTDRQTRALAQSPQREIIQEQLIRARVRVAQRLPGSEDVPSENRIFSSTILFLLAQFGPQTTEELHPRIQTMHPELCDDTIDRVIGGIRFGK